MIICMQEQFCTHENVVHCQLRKVCFSLEQYDIFDCLTYLECNQFFSGNGFLPAPFPVIVDSDKNKQLISNQNIRKGLAKDCFNCP